ncbi:putative transcription factor C2C2-CO-like family [Helianthus annuus]|nr:putative transcription factor C2C2-CO-like family [Helianthus annuus]
MDPTPHPPSLFPFSFAAAVKHHRFSAHFVNIVSGNGVGSGLPPIAESVNQVYRHHSLPPKFHAVSYIHTHDLYYACRKTLADSRPRVRGRFAKHDEFGENNITNSNHEEDTDEDEQNVHEVVKEEENFESSDILAHISGVNSFKCNYPIQSWI